MQARSPASAAAEARLWVPVPGGRLYVEVAGDGPPLLMIHGWPLDHRIFDAQVAGLKQDLTLIRYDRRGFGKSDAPPDLVREVDDIDTVLDALGQQSAHLLGMSQGGRIALRYAATRPDRVRSLVLQGAAVDGLPSATISAERIPVDEYAELAQAGNLAEVRQRWLRHPMMHLDQAHASEGLLVRKILDGYHGRDLLAIDADTFSSPIDVLAALPALRFPVLVITGARESDVRKRHAAELLKRVPDCREIVLADAGHLCNMTAAAEYNDAVREFCATGGANA
jgi:pimeloyl-ACP methyl ester carboxylesterase